MKVITKDGSVVDMSFEDEEGRGAFRHTASHILAQAVKRLYPTTKCAIGPSIADGFYYDFDFDFDFTAEHLAALEKEMKKIVKEGHPLKRSTMSRSDAIKSMKDRNED